MAIAKVNLPMLGVGVLAVDFTMLSVEIVFYTVISYQPATFHQPSIDQLSRPTHCSRIRESNALTPVIFARNLAGCIQDAKSWLLIRMQVPGTFQALAY
ncbi:uncharacterized protein MYCFIDRAFT_178906 [Pseudocercospora fijiensis CIRAD86]|uniref:Uncharacterized protein n=1 Tax=Pseudocercospora fijiensis (strain CIRAD86) TaxID=383855 RepID=M3A2W6_PSEFD|nr:uncharacterized protein MYCFIDRAFT_178906 [Pseudocercospora fijiensis CIRAD86]EME78806.1 hypothetical protein MYCFIDRAFT_178906 [Pseudocercospora fijiensis CIRAD86]